MKIVVDADTLKRLAQLAHGSGVELTEAVAALDSYTPDDVTTEDAEAAIRVVQRVAQVLWNLDKGREDAAQDYLDLAQVDYNSFVEKWNSR